MGRYFIELGFKGTHFHGWQLQNNAVTVQEMLDKSLSLLLNSSIETTGCGRTDTGVHAAQFFAHFDFDQLFDAGELTYRLNAVCGNEITVYGIYSVSADAHARFDAVRRSYSYYIARHKPLFHRELTWYYTNDLDIIPMNEAADLLLHYTDFSSFSKSGGQQFTNNCTITEARWIVHPNVLQFTITSNRFLRGMVRAITGTLLQAGRGEMNASRFREIIEAKDRTMAGPSVPAQGLSLEEIVYPYLHKPRRSPFSL